MKWDLSLKEWLEKYLTKNKENNKISTTASVWRWPPARPGLTSELVCRSRLKPLKLAAVFSQTIRSLESVQSLLSCLVAVSCLAEVNLFCLHRSIVTNYSAQAKDRGPSLKSGSVCLFVFIFGVANRHSWDADWSQVGNLETLIRARGIPITCSCSCEVSFQWN